MDQSFADAATTEGDPPKPKATKETPRRLNRRIAVASFSGTLIELYDFIIYGTAAALVFPKIFFPALGPAAGAAMSFATFGVAFVARPVGGLLFGHFGDRLGRKKTLVTTLFSMGLATVGVGLIPTADQIGIAAPIILVLLRLIQGLAAGGEWAGAMLFTAEHAPPAKRGLWTMFPQLGTTVAFSLANLTFLLTGLGMSDEAFTSWGWRIPFVGSIVLIGVGLWVRLKVEETPVFIKARDDNTVSKIPFMEAIKSQPREIVLGGGVGLTTFTFFFVTSTYLTHYATATMGVSRPWVLMAGVIGGLVLTASAAASAIVSDRIGRRPVMLTSHIVGIVWALALFPFLGLGSTAIFSVALWVTLFIAGINFGPLGSFLPELFDTRFRYSATGLSYNIGGVIGGAVAPLLATPIVSAWGPLAFGVFLAALCLTGAICTYLLRETHRDDLSHTPARG